MQIDVDSPALPFNFTPEDMEAIQSLLTNPLLQAYFRNLMNQILIESMNIKVAEDALTTITYAKAQVDLLAKLISPAAQAIKLELKNTNQGD